VTDRHPRERLLAGLVLIFALVVGYLGLLHGKPLTASNLLGFSAGIPGYSCLLFPDRPRLRWALLAACFALFLASVAFRYLL